MDWPRITVVTPTFNRSDYLEETILSVLDQNYPNLEYIIVDGGSTNHEIFEIIRKYEDCFAWWVSEPDSGHAEAIKKGFEKATGEILAWLCSDDTYLPGALIAVGKAFRKYPEADIFFGHFKSIDQNGKMIKDGRVVRYHPLQVLSNGNIHQASVFWTKDIYIRAGGNVGGLNLEFTKYSPDSDLYFRFIKTGAKWILIPLILSTFRIHRDHTTTKERNAVWSHYWKAAREAFPFWTKPGIFQLVRIFTRIRRIILLIAQGDGKYLSTSINRRIKSLLRI